MSDFKVRTRKFAVDIIYTVEKIICNPLVSSVIAKQLIRCATGIGANYRSALRGKSKSDFIAKLAIAEEEADESCYWLELLISLEFEPKEEIKLLYKEANEITAILTASGKTAKANRASEK